MRLILLMHARARISDLPASGFDALASELAGKRLLFTEVSNFLAALPAQERRLFFVRLWLSLRRFCMTNRTDYRWHTIFRGVTRTQLARFDLLPRSDPSTDHATIPRAFGRKLAEIPAWSPKEPYELHYIETIWTALRDRFELA